MTLSTKEFDALIQALPKDLEMTSPDFLISDDKGINIAGTFRGHPETMDVDLMLGSEHVDLTKAQKAFLSNAIFYSSTFQL